MSLKLFRHTGFSSILAPGETRSAPHPAWVMVLVCLWVALACNASLWREIARLPAAAGPGWAAALAWGLFSGSACALVLSLLGWRRTAKPAATAVLVIAAAAAWGAWKYGVPANATPPARLIASLPSSLRELTDGSFLIVVALLALLPAIVLWRTPQRRLSGSRQLSVNLTGALVAAVLVGMGALLLP